MNWVLLAITVNLATAEPVKVVEATTLPSEWECQFVMATMRAVQNKMVSADNSAMEMACVPEAEKKKYLTPVKEK